MVKRKPKKGGCNLFYEAGIYNFKLAEIWILCFVAFKYWGSEDVDINEELSGIANRAALGEEGINGNLSHLSLQLWI